MGTNDAADKALAELNAEAVARYHWRDLDCLRSRAEDHGNARHTDDFGLGTRAVFAQPPLPRAIRVHARSVGTTDT